MSKPAPQPARVCGRAARVVASTMICREHVAIELELPEFPDSEPGQFLQLQCSDPTRCETQTIDWPSGGFPSLASGETWSERNAYLRRPFSIADHWCNADGNTHLSIISRNVGHGTAWLEKLSEGDTVDISGPLGHGFGVPAADVPLVLVGGGVGIPPMLYLARRLAELECRDVTLIFGATTRDLLPVRLLDEPSDDGSGRQCVELPGNAHFPAIVTTDDGSCGLRGVVTDALRHWQQRRDAAVSPGATVFTCGPEAMLNAVAALTRELDLRCQVCIERRMGCGLGTCLSCVVRLNDQTQDEGWRWGLTCSDGPVFDRDELMEP